MGFYDWTLANGTQVSVPTYFCTIQIGELPELEASLIVLGEEVVIGRSLVTTIE